MSVLFSPLRLREVTLRNRIAVAPMCQYSCEDGVPNDWHLVHLGSRAVGGAGLVIAEATAVLPEGRISPADTGLWNDRQATAFAPIVRFMQSQRAVAGIQLAHAGRKASVDLPWRGGQPLVAGAGGWTPVAPSALPFASGHAQPVALAESEIEAIVDAFVAAARRAQQAGFEVVEIHAAHGYLLHEFLSPVANRRTDAYGGSLENRMRLPLRVVAAVRAAWPERLPLLVRVSATDWLAGGWDLAQTVAFAGRCKELGVDLIDCSSAGIAPDAQVPVGPGFQVPLAAGVRAQAGIATGAVGLLTSPAQCEQVVATGQADIVLLARELLRDPYWPLHAAQALHVETQWPQQYLRARG